MRLAMERLAREPRLALARRVVTRPPDGGSEDHDSLDERAFGSAKAPGAFCITWRAYGLAYGLPRAASGASPSSKSPRLILVARIAARGRETPSEIEARLARQVDLEMPLRAPGLLRIDNSGAPAIGADTLVRHLIAYAGQAHASR